MRRMFVGVVIATMVAISVCSTRGQSTFGTIIGVLRDKTQGAVQGASIKIRSLEDNSVRTATSDESGAFEIANLKPGDYEVTIHAKGFTDFEVSSTHLGARQTLRVDAQLILQTQSQTVEVSDTAPAINTENGVIGDVKAPSEITEMPLNFRASTTSPLAATFTSANVEQDSQGNTAVGGATANMVGYSVDGISTANIFTSSAGTNPYPSSEGIAELQVTAFNNNAEFSQVGDVTFTPE